MKSTPLRCESRWGLFWHMSILLLTMTNLCPATIAKQMLDMWK